MWLAYFVIIFFIRVKRILCYKKCIMELYFNTTNLCTEIQFHDKFIIFNLLIVNTVQFKCLGHLMS